MGGKRRHVPTSSDDDEEEPEPSTSKSRTRRPLQPKQSRKENDSEVAEPVQNPNNRAGRIVQMTLKNFMCHSFLEVKFDGSVNFLTGNNGSGKSAILAALTLGLGSEAKNTNRGNISSVKAFIKVGTNSACIEITLSNHGLHAYKPEQYGSKIMVRRYISSSGASNYKIKDEHGKVVGKKLKDVIELTNALNIQVNNPVCILSQDTARNFLNATDPKMRFNLFYRATRLDALNNLYEDSIKKKNMAQQTYKLKKFEENQLLKQCKKLDAKITEARKIEAINEALDKSKSELAWSKGVANEKKYEQQKAVVNKIAKDIENYETTYDKHKENLEKVQEEKRDLEAKLQELNTTHNENEKPVRELVQKIQERERHINEKNNTIASSERQLSYRKQDLTDLHKQIDNYNDRVAMIEQRKQTIQEDVSTHESNKKEMKNLAHTYEEEISKISDHMKEKEARMQSTQQELHAIRSKIHGLNDRLSSLQRDTNNPYAIYGQNVQRLINAIEDDVQNFSRPPIGPIGMHIAIKDKEWAVAVEACLNANLLNSFLVNSHKDSDRLLQIIKRIWSGTGGRQPSIISTKFVDRPYDVTKKLVAKHPNCIPFYDMLVVKNPIVMNCLLDQAKFEGTLLIPEKNYALQMLKSRATVPQNCRLGVTPQADTIYPDPGFKTYAGRLKHAKYIQVDCADAARQCEHAIEKEVTKETELRNGLKRAREEIALAGENLPRLKQKLTRCRHDMEVIARKINELQMQTVEEAGSVDDLKGEASELEQLIKTRSATITESKLEIEELEVQVNEFKQEMKRYDNVRREARRAKQEVQDELDKHGYKVQKFINEHARAKKRYEELEGNVANEKVILDKLKQFWEHLAADIEQEHGERPSHIRRLDVIQAEIDGLELQVAELRRFNLKTLLSDLELLNIRIDVHRDTMQETAETLEHLQEAKAGRKSNLLQTKRYMKDYSIHNFKTFLKCRNFQGNMDINYDNETLDMCVIPHTGARGITATTNLSGGERSFTTVAFLYALWKTLDFPFYILDEFDVYMDSQNRNLVIQILIDHAKKNEEAQYVFLTPQDISFIKDTQVAIHRLEDPERRALTK